MPKKKSIKAVGARTRFGWLFGWWTYIAVAVPQDFVQDVAELPAEDGVAVQREAQRVGPEGVGALLPVSPQNDPCGRDVKDEPAPHCFTPVSSSHCSSARHFFNIFFFKYLFKIYFCVLHNY